MDRVDATLRARYLRGACLLPDPCRGTKVEKASPQIDVTHAIIMLLACMDQGPQLRVHEAVRSLWSGPFRLRMAEGLPVCTNGKDEMPCLGAALQGLLARAVAGIPETVNFHSIQQINFGGLIRIQIMQNGQTQLTYHDKVDCYGISTDISILPSDSALLVKYSSVGVPLLAALADLVRESRAEALRLGVCLDSDDAACALTHPLSAAMDPGASRAFLRQIALDLRCRKRLADLRRWR